MIWDYTIVFLALMAGILIYFFLAKKLAIIDKPNERSSHSVITVRGGGIVFPLAVLLWFVQTGFQFPLFVLGVTLLASISFIDDIRPLSTLPRLVIHFLAVILILYDLGFQAYSWYWWLIAFILSIGWINAFNFMDGINGITAFYALAVLIPILKVNTTADFIDSDLIVYVSISLIAFSIFNARPRALCFAGDVGSVSMASIISFLMIALISKTGKWEYILFVSLYGIDTVLTIIQRLIKGENIFKAHRTHLYQYLANEMGWGHLKVAGLYAVIQLVISFLLLWISVIFSAQVFTLSLMAILVLVYIMVKRQVMQKVSIAQP